MRVRGTLSANDANISASKVDCYCLIHNCHRAGTFLGRTGVR
jgi:hypothetical protein